MIETTNTFKTITTNSQVVVPRWAVKNNCILWNDSGVKIYLWLGDVDDTVAAVVWSWTFLNPWEKMSFWDWNWFYWIISAIVSSWTANMTVFYF